MNAPDQQPGTPHVERIPLRLPESKDCLIEFLVSDLRDGIARAEQALPMFESAAERSDAGAKIAAIGDATARSARFFEFDSMHALGHSLSRLGVQAGRLVEDDIAQALPRIMAILELLKEQADGLAWSTIVRRPIAGLCDSVRMLLDTGKLSPDCMLKPGASAIDALIADGVIPREGDAPAPAFQPEPASAEPIPARSPMPFVQPVEQAPFPSPMHKPRDTTIADPQASQQLVRPDPAPAAIVEHVAPTLPLSPTSPTSDPFASLFSDSIPVAPDRLDALIGLVGDLVMQKNRLVSLAAHIPRTPNDPHRFHDHLSTVSTSVSRVAADIRSAVIEARRISLTRLCAILNSATALAAKASGRQACFVAEGADAEVDCGLLDRLSDPLTALIRAMVDLGIESPQERAAAGKPACGTLTLRAAIQGDSIRLELSDDGRGLSRRRISKKALRLGLIDAAALDALPDRQIFSLIFSPEYAVSVDPSTPDAHALHTIREAVERLGGTIEVDGSEGRGTAIALIVPLHSVTTPALIVEIGDQVFALPVSGVREVVDSESSVLSIGIQTITHGSGHLAVMDGCEVFNLPTISNVSPSTVVIVGQGARRIGLRVSRAVGTHDIVVRPLDPMALGSGGGISGPVCGATIRENGAIALVVDLARTIRLVEDRARAEALLPPRLGTAA